MFSKTTFKPYTYFAWRRFEPLKEVVFALCGPVPPAPPPPHFRHKRKNSGGLHFFQRERNRVFRGEPEEVSNVYLSPPRWVNRTSIKVPVKSRVPQRTGLLRRGWVQLGTVSALVWGYMGNFESNFALALLNWQLQYKLYSWSLTAA